MGVRGTFPFALAISILFFALAALMMISPSGASQQRVLLRDLSVVTLQRGGITQGRRSAGVPQLTCVGGTAKNYDSYWPDTVQCINQGFDGYDVQWECKADMDNDVKFGRIQMSCEGYDYPDDPYVLRGSCGLEYHLEFTKEGLRKRGSGDSGSWFGSDSGGSSWNRASSSESHASRSSERETEESSFSSIFVLLGFGIAIYFLYTCFISPATAAGGAAPTGPPPYEEHERHSRYPPPPPSASTPHGPRVYPDLGDDANSRSNAAPPPPGWNFDNDARNRGSNVHGFGGSTSSGGDYGSRTHTTTEEQPQQPPQQNQGFSWGTLLGGGLLGYLFGSGTNRYDRYAHRNGWGSGWGGGWGNGWGNHHHHNTGGSWWGGGNRGGGWGSNGGFSFGGGGSGGGGGGGGSNHSSSGSRTASGFGGTSRR